MKNLIKNIWDSPASTVAGGIVASVAIILASDIEAPKWVLITMSALSAFLATFSGSKPLK